MSGPVAYRGKIEGGLTEHDQRVATAVIYTRFRGNFSRLSRVVSRQGHVSLVVWGATLKHGPLFKVCRWNDKYVAIEENSRKVLEFDSLEDLFEAVRPMYPPSSPI